MMTLAVVAIVPLVVVLASAVVMVFDFNDEAHLQEKARLSKISCYRR